MATVLLGPYLRSNVRPVYITRLLLLLVPTAKGRELTQVIREAVETTISNDLEAKGPESAPGFVKKILLIPCMTKSLMYGISGGLGIGLGHFLLTSNVSRATNYGVGGYLVILFGTWGVCRYQVAQARFKYAQVQKAMQNREGHTNLKHLDPKDV